MNDNDTLIKSKGVYLQPNQQILFVQMIYERLMNGIGPLAIYDELCSKPPFDMTYRRFYVYKEKAMEKMKADTEDYMRNARDYSLRTYKAVINKAGEAGQYNSVISAQSRIDKIIGLEDASMGSNNQGVKINISIQSPEQPCIPISSSILT